jgi:hypothetical protein
LAAQRPHKIHAYVNVILTTQKEHTKSSPNKDKDVMSLKIGLCDLREGCWPLQEKKPKENPNTKMKNKFGNIVEKSSHIREALNLKKVCICINT